MDLGVPVDNVLRKNNPINNKPNMYHILYVFIYLFIFLCQIPVILSIPNKDVLHMNNNSTTSGAGITMMVQ